MRSRTRRRISRRAAWSRSGGASARRDRVVHAQLQRDGGQFRRAREREKELNRLERFTALGQLAGGLAHEIKNPLNFIWLALDQLRARYAPQQRGDRDEFLHQLGMMKDEMWRLSELIQSFLHYGKPIEIFRRPPTCAGWSTGRGASESKMKSQGIELDEERNEESPDA